MGPKREKIISKSSSVVTGFNLQTNRTLSGGFTSASGKSPTYVIHKFEINKTCIIRIVRHKTNQYM